MRPRVVSPSSRFTVGGQFCSHILDIPGLLMPDQGPGAGVASRCVFPVSLLVNVSYVTDSPLSAQNRGYTGRYRQPCDHPFHCWPTRNVQECQKVRNPGLQKGSKDTRLANDFEKTVKNCQNHVPTLNTLSSTIGCTSVPLLTTFINFMPEGTLWQGTPRSSSRV